MVLTSFMKYLLIINGIGLIMYIINMLLYTYTSTGQIDALLTIVSLAGGSLGIVIAILLFDRKARKENMMSRVFVFCILIIQVVVLLVFRGHFTDTLSLNLLEFFGRRKWLVTYLIIINFVSFAAFAVDKIAAIKKEDEFESSLYSCYALQVALSVD